jgi:hypothetical protein
MHRVVDTRQHCLILSTREHDNSDDDYYRHLQIDALIYGHGLPCTGLDLHRPFAFLHHVAA